MLIKVISVKRRIFASVAIKRHHVQPANQQALPICYAPPPFAGTVSCWRSVCCLFWMDMVFQTEELNYPLMNQWGGVHDALRFVITSHLLASFIADREDVRRKHSRSFLTNVNVKETYRYTSLDNHRHGDRWAFTFSSMTDFKKFSLWKWYHYDETVTQNIAKQLNIEKCSTTLPYSVTTEWI